MHVTLLGDLVVGKHRNWVSEPVPVPMFGGEPMIFGIDEAALGPGLEAAVMAFLSLSDRDRMAASPWIFASWTDTVDAIRARPYLYLPNAQPILDLPLRESGDVWALVRHSGGVSIQRREEDALLYVSVGLRVPWDPEHGLVLTWRRGEVLSRVSEYDGHLTTADAYGLPESEDRIWFSRADALRRLAEREAREDE